MKYSYKAKLWLNTPSLPLRERGLKLLPADLLQPIRKVAPLAGAWIEIHNKKYTDIPARSLPLRERGLKYNIVARPSAALESLPLRERGLKCRDDKTNVAVRWSLPLRERGLKFVSKPRCRHKSQVAPLAGAWIEISLESEVRRLKRVAPLAGAWIEIYVFAIAKAAPAGSLPLRERGLKFPLS